MIWIEGLIGAASIWLSRTQPPGRCNLRESGQKCDPVGLTGGSPRWDGTMVRKIAQRQCRCLDERRRTVLRAIDRPDSAGPQPQISC